MLPSEPTARLKRFRPSSLQIALGCIALMLGLLWGATPASANFFATGVDPAGDSTDANPGRDIVRVGFAYNRRTGHIRGGVVLRGNLGEAPANLTLFAGNRTATGCNAYPAIGFGTQTDLRGAHWVLLTSATAPPTFGEARKTYDDVAEEYEATARQLAGKRPNCVIAQLDDPANPGVVYDIAGPYKLRAMPELATRLGKVPSIMRPNRERKIRVTVSNPGDAATGRVRLRVSKARGLKVRGARQLPSIRPGARRHVILRVTLNRRAKMLTNLEVTAVAKNKIRATASDRLYISRSSGTRKPPSAGGGEERNRLCFRYTWMPPYGELAPC